MCPACLTTAASAVTGVTSVGGLTALVVKKFCAQTGAKHIDPKPEPKEKSS